MKSLIIEPFSGISGDMFISALIDAGLDKKALFNEFKKLNLVKQVQIRIKNTKYNEISAKQFIVQENKKKVRHIEEIKKIINTSKLEKDVKEKSISMINRLEKAERKIHKKFDHFHELGELDTIIDIVGAIVGLKLLKIEKVFSKPVNVGKGFVNTAHGVMPVPAPATMEILKGIPIYSEGPSAELVTPTGAVILKEFVSDYSIPTMKMDRIGYGAGLKNFQNFPNLLRVGIGESLITVSDKILIETNIDDMNPEIYSYLMEKLFKAGALDVYLTSIYMKKNRPGILLTCICEKRLKNKMAEIIFREASTIGIRIYYPERVELERSYEKVKTKYGTVTVKVSKYNSEVVNISPEYEECKKIASKNNIPLKEIYDIVRKSKK